MNDEVIGFAPRVVWSAPDWIRWPAFAWLVFCSFLFARGVFGLERDRYGQRIDLNWMVQRTLHFFGVWTGGPGDTNFKAADMASGADAGVDWVGTLYEWKLRNYTAEELRLAAELVEMVEAKVVGPAIREWIDWGETARDLVWLDAPNLLGVDDYIAAQMIRLWTGCLDGAKTIAISTRIGRNWPWWRRQQSARVELRAATDLDYAKGALAAFAFKRGRNEPVSFIGVAKGNVLRAGREILEAA